MIHHRAHGGTEVNFGYDSMNRLTASAQLCALVTSVVENSYDLNGNRTNILYPGGLTVSYEYDEENQLEASCFYESSRY